MTYLDAIYTAPALKLATSGVDNVLIEIMAEHPGITAQDALPLFRERLRADPELADLCFDFVCHSRYVALIGKKQRWQQRGNGVDKRKRAERVDLANKVTSQVKQQLFILDTVMPNGKLLRYCTGTYALKLGGDIAKIGKAAGSAVIGKKLSDKQVKDLLRSGA